MKITDYDKLKMLFAGMAGVAILLAIFGMADISSTPYSGYQASFDYRIVGITPNSPAALAGMRVGDNVIEIAGIPTAKLYQLSKQPRPKVGEDEKVVILRDGIRHDLAIKQTSLPFKEAFLIWVRDFIALVMVLVGLVLYWWRPTKASSLFFLCNLGVGLAFMTPPYFESFLLRSLVTWNTLVFLMMGLTFFLHLTVVFPTPKPAVVETPIESLIYLIAPLIAIYYLLLRLFQPEADLMLNQTLHYAFGLLVLMCLGLGLAALVHSYWTERSAERSRALGVALAGSLIGITPSAVGLLTESFLPQLVLPGREYYPLLVVVATLSLGWALWRMKDEQEWKGLRKVA